MSRTILCASVILALVTTAAIADQPVETRTHYVISDRNRGPLYRATVITSNTDKKSSETYLFETVDGAHVRVDIQRSYDSHLVNAEYTVNEGKPVKVKLELPGTATTIDGIRKEYKDHPELRSADVPVTVEAYGQVVKTGERDWKSGRDRDKAKAAVGAATAETLTQLTSVLGFPQFGGACSTIGFVTNGGRCQGNPSLMIAVIRPDCAFDAKFGLPCDGSQQQRAKAQPKKGRVGAY